MVCKASEWVLKKRLENFWNRFAVSFLNRMLLKVFDELISNLLFAANFRLFIGVARAFAAKTQFFMGKYSFENQLKYLIFRRLQYLEMS